jgi:hypothetical protein
VNKQLPFEIQRCFELGALKLGISLEVLEWPSGGKNAAPPEINALINVIFYLCNLPRPFQIYAEGTCASGRIDMMGYNGETAIAIEAKNFGEINKQAVALLKDLERLRTFVPVLAENLNDGLTPNQWWQNAQARWGIILISSFRGRDVADAWISQEEGKFQEIMSRYSKQNHAQTDMAGYPTGFFKLYKAFDNANRGATRITTAARWKGDGEGWFLWGALPL